MCRSPSIPVTWSNVPAETKSLILLIDQVDSMPQYFIHWLVIDIPATGTHIINYSSAWQDMHITLTISV
jgi:phosphatidylethanolamine-binding protein (PEBP) family uncharacterized protein